MTSIHYINLNQTGGNEENKRKVILEKILEQKNNLRLLPMDPTECNGIKYKLEVSIPKLVNTNTLLLKDGQANVQLIKPLEKISSSDRLIKPVQSPQPLQSLQPLQQDAIMARLAKEEREKVNKLSQQYNGKCPWQVYTPDGENKEAYYNKNTQETTWEKPIDLKWQSKDDKDDNTFYYNEDINKNISTWNKPDCFDIENNN